MRVLPTCVVCASQAPETLSLELQMTGSHQAGVTTELGLQEGHSVLSSPRCNWMWAVFQAGALCSAAVL